MVWREADARDPVSVSFILDCVLALGQSIPQFNGLVPGTGHDLTVVSGESDGEDVLKQLETFISLRADNLQKDEENGKDFF